MKHAEVQDWTYAKVCDTLAASAGFERGMLDRSRVAWIVRSRMDALGLADEALYVAALANSAEEVRQLVEHAVVPETRFFRDSAVFENLRRWLAQVSVSTTGVIRVLSAPCSTGQEAYSLAALMLDAGIPPERFVIDALDISHNALETAKLGVYAAGAFRHLSKDLQRACGMLVGDRLEIHDAIRERVRFMPCNLATKGALQHLQGGPQAYQLVLCRNLFIYLHRQARATLAASLADAVAPGGRLVLGSADHVSEVSDLFVPVAPASSFAFVLRESVALAEPKAETALPDPGEAVARQAAADPAPAIPLPVRSGSTAEDLYERALHDHRQGDLRRAERRCRQALYLAPEMLPALELLESLWKGSANLRLRRALGERIQRQRLREEMETA